jgi:hypothetical protein
MITYRVIGKRPGLIPEVDTACDGWLGVEMGEIPFGVALGILPDGLIVQACVDDDPPRYYEIQRMQLVGVDPERPGTMLTTKRARPVVASKEELWAERTATCLAYRDLRAGQVSDDRLEVIRRDDHPIPVYLSDYEYSTRR